MTNTPTVCPNCDTPAFALVMGDSLQRYNGKTLIVRGIERMRCACGCELLTDEQADTLNRKRIRNVVILSRERLTR